MESGMDLESVILAVNLRNEPSQATSTDGKSAGKGSTEDENPAQSKDPTSVAPPTDAGDKTSEKHAASTKGKPAGKGKGKIEDKKPQNYVILGSLLSFDCNMSKELINDLIEVSLFSQLAASSSYDRLKKPEDWYKEYFKFMNMLGWTSQEFDFVSFKSHEKVFEISTVVTDKAKKLLADKKEMLDAIQSTFEAVKKADSKTVELFNSNSSGGGSGNFQVGTCSEDKSGMITMVSVNDYFTTEEKIKDFIFFKFENTKIKMFMSSGTLTFNKDQYRRVRDNVQQKLGDVAKKDVRKLPDIVVKPRE